jgi:hypothetical protein
LRNPIRAAEAGSFSNPVIKRRGALQQNLRHLNARLSGRHLAASRATLVTFCAWCGRLRVAGRWLGKPRTGDFVAHVKRETTTGICPACFADFAPGRRYPGQNETIP